MGERELSGLLQPWGYLSYLVGKEYKGLINVSDIDLNDQQYPRSWQTGHFLKEKLGMVLGSLLFFLIVIIYRLWLTIKKKKHA